LLTIPLYNISNSNRLLKKYKIWYGENKLGLVGGFEPESHITFNLILTFIGYQSVFT